MGAGMEWLDKDTSAGCMHGICSSCGQKRNVFSFKAPETTTSFPATNAVNQLSGV